MEKKQTLKLKIAQYTIDLITYLFALLMLFPLYWMIAGSIMTDLEISSIPPVLVPSDFDFGNYIELYRRSPILTWFRNSVWVSAATSFLYVLISAMAGYAYAKKEFFLRGLLFYTVIITMTIPKQVLIVPQFKIINTFNMFDTYMAMIIPALGWPLGTFLMRQFMVTLPSELISSAKIDGCGELGIFNRIIVPLAKPAIGALAIFTFVKSWNDYVWQLLVIRSKLLKTLPLGIAGLQEEFSSRYGLIFAGATIASLPMILVFTMFQKYFTKGLTVGAVKG